MTDHQCPTGYHSSPTMACYSTHGCRCRGCKDAVNTYHKQSRKVGAKCQYRDKDTGYCQQRAAEGDRCKEHHYTAVVASWWPLPVPVLPDTPRFDWRDLAACEGLDTDLFFNDKGEHIPVEVTAACAACPVRGDCTLSALNTPISEDDGIRGGLNKKTRAKLRHVLGIRPRNPIPNCGTTGGYKRHRRIGEQPCRGCRAAYAEYEQQRRAS